jgi:hypothetical protein
MISTYLLSSTLYPDDDTTGITNALMQNSLKQFETRLEKNGESLNDGMKVTTRSLNRQMKEHDRKSSKNGTNITTFRLIFPEGFVGTPKAFQAKASLARIGDLAITPELLMLYGDVATSIVPACEKLRISKFGIGFLVSVNAPNEESALFKDDNEKTEEEEMMARMLSEMHVTSPPKGMTCHFRLISGCCTVILSHPISHLRARKIHPSGSSLLLGRRKVQRSPPLHPRPLKKPEWICWGWVSMTSQTSRRTTVMLLVLSILLTSVIRHVQGTKSVEVRPLLIFGTYCTYANRSLTID